MRDYEPEDEGRQTYEETVEHEANMDDGASEDRSQEADVEEEDEEGEEGGP